MFKCDKDIFDYLTTRIEILNEDIIKPNEYKMDYEPRNSHAKSIEFAYDESKDELLVIVDGKKLDAKSFLLDDKNKEILNTLIRKNNGPGNRALNTSEDKTKNINLLIGKLKTKFFSIDNLTDYLISNDGKTISRENSDPKNIHKIVSDLYGKYKKNLAMIKQDEQYKMLSDSDKQIVIGAIITTKESGLKNLQFIEKNYKDFNPNVKKVIKNYFDNM